MFFLLNSTDGSNGYIAPNDLVQDLSMARKLFPGLGGVAGWQWGSDTNGTWIATVSGGFKSPAHVEGERV